MKRYGKWLVAVVFGVLAGACGGDDVDLPDEARITMAPEGAWRVNQDASAMRLDGTEYDLQGQAELAQGRSRAYGCVAAGASFQCGAERLTCPAGVVVISEGLVPVAGLQAPPARAYTSGEQLICAYRFDGRARLNY